MKDWEDSYEIRLRKDTETIEVRYKNNKNIMQPYLSKHNSYLYSLRDGVRKSSITVQKLTAIHYIKNPKNFINVIHIDDNKANNKLSNLKWDKKKCKMGTDNHASKGIIKVYKDGVFQFNLNGKKEIVEKGFFDGAVYKCVYGLQKIYKGYTFIRENLTEEEKNEKLKEYENKKIINRPKKTKYVLDKMKTDPIFRIKQTLRKRVLNALKTVGIKKAHKTVELIGCSVEMCKEHIEKQFQEGMGWHNHGPLGWHIDHIIPCSAFDLTDPEQQKKCFHYTNLQPLWYHDNLSKGSKIL